MKAHHRNRRRYRPAGRRSPRQGRLQARPIRWSNRTSQGNIILQWESKVSPAPSAIAGSNVPKQYDVRSCLRHWFQDGNGYQNRTGIYRVPSSATT